MDAEIDVRPGTSDDTGRILDLVRLSLGEGAIPRHVDYWTWKHEENPFGRSACLLATAGEELVGLRMFMRWEWEADGSSLSAVRAVDTATHPEWRGRGIFTRLTLALLDRVKSEGVSFVFNTPNDQSRPGYLKMGWEQIGRVSLWIRPMRPLRLIGGALTGGARAPADDREFETDLGDPAEQVLGDGALDGFLESMSKPAAQFSTPRTVEYLRWRYGAVPGIRYRAAARIDGERGAVVIFRPRARGRLRELRLCDVLVGSGSGSSGVARRILRSLMRRSEADYAAAMAPMGSSRISVLGATGFLPAPRLGPVMTVRPLNDGGARPDPLRRSDWHLSIGDLELF